MKRETSIPPEGKAARPTAGKVLKFPVSPAAAEARYLAERQRAVRVLLNDLSCSSDNTAPVAIGFAVVRPDGAVEFGAVGVEREFALQTASALDRLADVVRLHSTKQKAKRHSQSGFALLAPLMSLAFMGATYLNQVAWIDSILMLSSHLIFDWLRSRSSRQSG